VAVLSLVPSYDELRLTVLGAEMVLPSLTEDEQIILSCEISSLPTYNCNVVFQRLEVKNEVVGQMCFQSSRPLVNTEISLDVPAFEKLKSMCCYGEPVRPITLYLKVAKGREIKNGEIIMQDNDFVLNIFDLSWRHPLF